MTREIFDNAKNMIGWKTHRKIVVFAVDDYGNVRLASKEARAKLDEAGLPILNRFDAYDTLEDSDDLHALFEVLTSVKDKNGRWAVFTPLALPMNLDFDRIIDSGYTAFYNELLTDTFNKTPGYQDTFKLWREGMGNGIFMPQFHGREHLNLKVFMHLLENKDHQLITNLQNRSYTSISAQPFPDVACGAAFNFQHFAENEQLKTIIVEGLDAFAEVFGRRARLFNAPGGNEHGVLHQTLVDNGIKYIETQLLKKEHQGEGKYKRRLNYTGKRNKYGQTILVRNCVFEPTENRGVDWVNFTLKQVEAAFRWNKPAHISSHRVNFCGRIDENNRKTGLGALRKLLREIVHRWPDVEFMSADELGDNVTSS